MHAPAPMPRNEHRFAGLEVAARENRAIRALTHAGRKGIAAASSIDKAFGLAYTLRQPVRRRTARTFRQRHSEEARRFSRPKRGDRRPIRASDRSRPRRRCRRGSSHSGPSAASRNPHRRNPASSEATISRVEVPWVMEDVAPVEGRRLDTKRGLHRRPAAAVTECRRAGRFSGPPIACSLHRRCILPPFALLRRPGLRARATPYRMGAHEQTESACFERCSFAEPPACKKVLLPSRPAARNRRTRNLPRGVSGHRTGQRYHRRVPSKKR